MSRLARRFRTLRWRLMLSYFVAALAAMMTLEVLFVLGPGLLDLIAPPRPVVLVQDLQQLAPRLAPDLAQSLPNRTRLAATLASFTRPILVPVVVTDNLQGSAAIVPGQNAALVVVGQDGAVLAELPARSPSAADLARIQASVAARSVIAAALHGGSHTTDLIQNAGAGQTVVAVPIADAQGTVRGALLLGVDFDALARPLYLANLLPLLPSTILFGIIASIFGAIFGLLTARGLTRRLRRLTTAADAWSQGDFTASARDPSADELGQLARDLNRMAEQLQTLLQDRQQLAVAEERNRLARDLHDSVKQQIFALTMLIGSTQLEVQDNAEAQRLLGEAERTARGVQQEMAALIQALRPVAMEHKDLSTALREQCAEWAGRSGIACDARFADGMTLAPAVEQEVFRTVQEALANVAKHSGATRVEVRAEEERGELVVRIRDNGRGFDVARSLGRGLGLRSMRERIEGLGGSFSISSSVGGTRIEMRTPLTSGAQNGQVTAQAGVARDNEN
jgi:NarL family two-component system sensor histidine kinase LiaS